MTPYYDSLETCVWFIALELNNYPFFHIKIIQGVWKRPTYNILGCLLTLCYMLQTFIKVYTILQACYSQWHYLYYHHPFTVAICKVSMIQSYSCFLYWNCRKWFVDTNSLTFLYIPKCDSMSWWCFATSEYSTIIFSLMYAWNCYSYVRNSTFIIIAYSAYTFPLI